jgi:hypothetical protein
MVACLPENWYFPKYKTQQNTIEFAMSHCLYLYLQQKGFYYCEFNILF